MNRTGGGRPQTHRPAAAAKLIGCSEWWLKEQARKRRIPYAWIGGSYRFTDQHITEIITTFEVRPEHQPTRTGIGATRKPRTVMKVAPVVELRARIPRRTRQAQTQNAQAA
ncbi:hypothetical protein GCM10010124_00220 [Pilimelia terevasa]|uniref:Uncharacterized protein n=1 Tax=Pilimelia terevasa TaxID=53372 RepID=A0A8J3BI18_9ACTN|nr:DNA-binding protein [Pilimelia terevasa]GGK11550.1 hypothetical protein GCM10010124_00220 [Pilimelia terevasa]